MKLKLKISFILTFLIGLIGYAQVEQSIEGNIHNLPVKEYTLTIKKEMVTKAGKKVMGMTINGSIPGPTLEFTEGDYAVIYVKNEMDVETSVHWHGLLLPNFYDGVPYLTTPPIEAGHTLKYEFEIKQSGTYWYHGHTMLQEQTGVFGSLVIHPKTKHMEYDYDQVLMLSDWINEKPMSVLRNLKRGSEWYGIKKGTNIPLNKVITKGALGAQLNFWKQRMEGADIADIAYDAFLINGQQTVEYPKYKAGDKVRLRIVDGAASTNFWITFGGGKPQLIASDGLDIVPVQKDFVFIAIAEAYDFIITIPENGKIEFRITAQDGSGVASAFFGTGKLLAAPIVPKPDKIKMMKKMAKMNMKMGAHAIKFRPKKDERFAMKKKYGMKMNKDDGKMKMKMNDNSKMDDKSKMDMKMPTNAETMDMESEKMKKNTLEMSAKESKKTPSPMRYMTYDYSYLKSPEKTSFAKDVPVNEVLLNLTGNMQRYIWSMNGVPLSETDNIKIKQNQVTRITLNNLTMMHHPMHLHGHFFRVLNENGEYSPLKHTVNVPPMQKVTLEFYGNEYGDWFFHCHILYHMMGGMARVFSYDTHRDERMNLYPAKKIVDETNRYYSWGTLDIASNMVGLNFTSSNLRNQFNATLEYGWNKNLEAELSYEYYLHDYLRVFGGMNLENEIPDSLSNFTTVAMVGLRYLTPYLFSLDARLDTELRPRVSLRRSVMIFPKFSVFGYFEYQLDFGLIDNLPNGKDYISETVWSTGAEYMFSRNFSLMANYDNRFGLGGGLSIRF